MTTTPTPHLQRCFDKRPSKSLSTAQARPETQDLRGKLDPDDPSIQVPAVQAGKPESGEPKRCSRSLGRTKMAFGLPIFSMSMKNQRKLYQESQLFFAQSQDHQGLYVPPACRHCFLLQCQGSLTPLLSGMRKKDPSTAEQAQVYEGKMSSEPDIPCSPYSSPDSGTR